MHYGQREVSSQMKTVYEYGKGAKYAEGNLKQPLESMGVKVVAVTNNINTDLVHLTYGDVSADKGKCFLYTMRFIKNFSVIFDRTEEVRSLGDCSNGEAALLRSKYNTNKSPYMKQLIEDWLDGAEQSISTMMTMKSFANHKNGQYGGYDNLDSIHIQQVYKSLLRGFCFNYNVEQSILNATATIRNISPEYTLHVLNLVGIDYSLYIKALIYGDYIEDPANHYTIWFNTQETYKIISPGEEAPSNYTFISDCDTLEEAEAQIAALEMEYEQNV